MGIKYLSSIMLLCGVCTMATPAEALWNPFKKTKKSSQDSANHTNYGHRNYLAALRTNEKIQRDAENKKLKAENETLKKQLASHHASSTVTTNAAPPPPPPPLGAAPDLSGKTTTNAPPPPPPLGAAPNLSGKKSSPQARTSGKPAFLSDIAAGGGRSRLKKSTPIAASSKKGGVGAKTSGGSGLLFSDGDLKSAKGKLKKSTPIAASSKKSGVGTSHSMMDELSRKINLRRGAVDTAQDDDEEWG